jgi:hypothetical protein
VNLSPTACMATAFGLLMAAASAVGADGPALAAAVGAALAVLAGIVFRWAATLAVVASACAIAIAAPAPTAAVLAGLCGAAYLVLRHGSGSETATVPTIVGALSFSLFACLAMMVPLQLAWLPLVAPAAVFAVYVIVLRPLFVGSSR